MTSNCGVHITELRNTLSLLIRNVDFIFRLPEAFVHSAYFRCRIRGSVDGQVPSYLSYSSVAHATVNIRSVSERPAAKPPLFSIFFLTL